MDSVFFADILKESLVERGSACLPGLGSLVLEEVPAYFSDKGFTINPPYQKVVFHPEEGGDDSLVRRYAKDNGVSVTRASEIVSEHVASLEKDLRVSRAVLLPGLGYLRMTHDGNVFFVAGEGLSLGLDYDMLEPVSLRNLPALSATVYEPEPDPAPEPAATAEPTAEPEPAIEPTAEATVVTDPEPAIEPESVAEPDTEPVIEPASVEPEPAATQEPIPEPELVSEPEPTAEPAAEPTAEPAAEPTAEPAAPVVNPEPTPAPDSLPAKAASRTWLWMCLGIVGVALLLLAALALCGRLCPDIVDYLLYSEEEIAIIRSVL